MLGWQFPPILDDELMGPCRGHDRVVQDRPSFGTAERASPKGTMATSIASKKYPGSVGCRRHPHHVLAQPHYPSRAELPRIAEADDPLIAYGRRGNFARPIDAAARWSALYGSRGGAVGAISMMSLAPDPPTLPMYGASPKVKIPPSEATSQYPRPSGVEAIPTIGLLRRTLPVEP